MLYYRARRPKTGDIDWRPTLTHFVKYLLQTRFEPWGGRIETIGCDKLSLYHPSGCSEPKCNSGHGSRKHSSVAATTSGSSTPRDHACSSTTDAATHYFNHGSRQVLQPGLAFRAGPASVSEYHLYYWPRPEFRLEAPQISFINLPDSGPNLQKIRLKIPACS